MKNSGLFTRMAIPVLALIIIIMLVLILFIPVQLHDTVTRNVIENSEATVNQFKTLRKYYTQNVIKKVVQSPDLSPGIDHRNAPDKVPLPATMIHDLSSLMADKGLTIKLYSNFPFPNRQNRQLDSFQRSAWDQLVQSPGKTVVEESEVGGKTLIRVAIADTMVADACVACHNNHPDTPKNNWKMGDVRGVLEVTTDISDQLAAGQSTSLKITAVVVGMLIIMLLWLWGVYQKVIQHRINKLNRAMDEIAAGDGDLTVMLEEKGKDEITHLSRSFNQFTHHIRSMVEHMARSSQALNNTAEAMNDLASKSKNRLGRQAAETSQAATAINQMVATVADVAKNATEAAQAAQTASHVTQDGQKVVENTRNDVDTLSGNVNKAMSTIRHLEEKSENINGMVGVIRSIAEQTNLLALNAAIEAARAGEQGRGFAVVADEVRSLASRTQEATEEIQQVIEELQSGTQTSVSVMQQSCEHAERTVEQAASANEALNAIASSIAEISSMNDQIASASEEQSAVAHEIEQNIMAINNMSEEAAGASERVAKNSAELSQLAQELDKLVSRFKY